MLHYSIFSGHLIVPWHYTTHFNLSLCILAATVSFFLACGLYCVSKQHTYSISHTQTCTNTHLQMAARLLRGVCVCEGNVVPRISITGSWAGVSPYTKDAGTLEALGPNRGRDGKGKRKSASARLPNITLQYNKLYWPGTEIAISKPKHCGRLWFKEKWHDWQRAHVFCLHKTQLHLRPPHLSLTPLIP